MNAAFQALGLDVNWQATLTFGSLVMTRIIAMASIIPFLVGRPVPVQVRMAFAISLLIFLFPYVRPPDVAIQQIPTLGFVVLFLKETLYGVAIGLIASLVFHAFEAAGSFIDNQRGAAQARLLIPQLGEQGGMFGMFQMQLGIVIFLSTGGHRIFLKTFVESYTRLPVLEMPGGAVDLTGVIDLFINMTGDVILVAVQLAGPVMVAIFLSDLILALMNRMAPAINVWEMGFAVRAVSAVVVFFLAFGFIVEQMDLLNQKMLLQVKVLIEYLMRSLPPPS